MKTSIHYWTRQAQRGFTLLEVTVAFAIFMIAALGIIQAVNATMVRSEINRELKIAIFDARSVVEEVQGKVFDEIANISYGDGIPYYPQGPVDILAHLGFDPADLVQQHLSNERIFIYFFVDSTSQSQLIQYSEATMLATKDAGNNYYLPNTLKNDNSTAGCLTAPPDPLRFTVVVFWDTPFIDATSPTGFRRMRFEIPFMITRMLNDDK